MFKKIAAIFLLIVLGLFVWQHELVSYGLSQAKGQMRIIWGSKPVEDYLADPEYPDSLKSKILLIREIRDYAVENLGLKGRKNYEKLYDQQGKPVLWVATAAPPFKMEAIEWSFPVIGSFSYKGFFDYEMSQKEIKGLKEQGLDASLRIVNGWSTLGWLRDPILSSMLEKDEGQLADLIIHELTHTTLFIKDSVEFNENLATFIGAKGAEMFLAGKYGSASPELSGYISKREDRSRFASYVLKGADYLDNLYDSFDEQTPIEQRYQMKEEAISGFIKNLDTVRFNEKGRYAGWFDGFMPDNTYFLSFTSYRSNLDELERRYRNQFRSDLKEMISYYSGKYKSL